MKSASDYYPFGMGMVGRQVVSANGYRYGYGTQEKDNDIEEGIYTAEYWQYDSRLGRRWNIDPMGYSDQSPYACFNNNPIYFNDPSGLEGENSKKGYYVNNHGDYFYQNNKNKKLPTGNNLIWTFVTDNISGGSKQEVESRLKAMSGHYFNDAASFNENSNWAQADKAEKAQQAQADAAALRRRLASLAVARKNSSNLTGGSKPATLSTYHNQGSGSQTPHKSQGRIPYFSGLGYDLLTTAGSTILGVTELSSLNTQLSEVKRAAENLRIKNASTISQYATCTKYLGYASKLLGAGDLVNSGIKIWQDPSKATFSDYAWFAGDAIMFGASFIPQVRAASYAAKYAPQLARYAMPMAYQGIQFGLGTTYSITKTWFQNK